MEKLFKQSLTRNSNIAPEAVWKEDKDGVLLIVPTDPDPTQSHNLATKLPLPYRNPVMTNSIRVALVEDGWGIENSNNLAFSSIFDL